MSEALFSGQIGSLNAKEISVGFSDVPSITINEDLNLIDALVFTKAASSKREAREFISNKAISVNGEIISDLTFIITKKGAIDRQFTVIRRGKKNYYLIKHQ